MIKIKTLVMSLIFIYCFSINIRGEEAEEDFRFEDEAKVLNELGVFKGKSLDGFEPALADGLTRQEGMKLLSDILLWDMEEERVSDFKDVSSWAQPYVAAAIEKGVTNGMGQGRFGGAEPVSYLQFYTWILRELGYEDVYDYDAFIWEDNIKNHIRNMGLLFNEVKDYNKPISRDYAVGIMYGLLFLEAENGAGSLIERIMDKNRPEDLSSKVEELLGSGLFANGYFAGALLSNGMNLVPVSEANEILVRLVGVQVDSVDDFKNPILYVSNGQEVLKTEGQVKGVSLDGQIALELDFDWLEGFSYYISGLTYENSQGSTVELTQMQANWVLIVGDSFEHDAFTHEVKDIKVLQRYIGNRELDLVVYYYDSWSGYSQLMEDVYMTAAYDNRRKALFVKVDCDWVDVKGLGIYGSPHLIVYKQGIIKGEYMGYYYRSPAIFSKYIAGLIH